MMSNSVVPSTQQAWIEAELARGQKGRDAIIELLSVLKSLSDQVHGIRMADPPPLATTGFSRYAPRNLSIKKGGRFRQ